MSKLTGLHSIFRKISIFGSNMGFHALCLPCPKEMLSTEGDISGGYRGKLDQPIVHGWGVEACCPASPVPEPVQVPGLGWQCHNTSRQNQQNFFHQNNVVGIDWPVRSSDLSTIWRCDGQFLTEGLTHNTGTKKPPGSQDNCSISMPFCMRNPVTAALGL